MATVFQGLKQHLPTMLSRWSLGPVSGKAQIPTSVTDVEKAIHNGIKCTRYRWFNEFVPIIKEQNSTKVKLFPQNKKPGL